MRLHLTLSTVPSQVLPPHTLVSEEVFQVLYEDCAPEEVWAELCWRGLCPGREHYIYGEPTELLTHVWVQEVYLEYQQVPDSDPAHYEFLWGPRAYVETSKFKVLEYLERVG